MNWYPIGLLLRDKIDQCIAVDIGSTTTDFILIKANKIINKRIDDLSGLNTNELLYLGCLRSPLYAVSKNINCSEIVLEETNKKHFSIYLFICTSLRVHARERID